jgi:acetyltransferase-like isoleucine patch superfamily enzyme
MSNGFQRAEYLKKQKIFASMGNDCFWQPHIVPPEAELIKMNNNVVVASEVLFVTHDVIHYVLRKVDPDSHFSLNLGAIEIGDNVFIGNRSTILPDTIIGDRVIIGAGSLVKGKIESNSVYVGIPARKIGNFDSVIETRKSQIESKRVKSERYDETWELFNKKFGK